MSGDLASREDLSRVLDRVTAPPVEARVSDAVVTAAARDVFGNFDPEQKELVGKILGALDKRGYAFTWVDPIGVPA